MNNLKREQQDYEQMIHEIVMFFANMRIPAKSGWYGSNMSVAIEVICSFMKSDTRHLFVSPHYGNIHEVDFPTGTKFVLRDASGNHIYQGEQVNYHISFAPVPANSWYWIEVILPDRVVPPDGHLDAETVQTTTHLLTGDCSPTEKTKRYLVHAFVCSTCRPKVLRKVKKAISQVNPGR